MEHALDQQGQTKILHLKGDIDLNHSPTLRRVLQERIKERCPALVINFRDVSYIDSSGLATLVEYYQGCRGFSGRVALAELNLRVRSVFDLVRLGEVFQIHATVDEATRQLDPS